MPDDPKGGDTLSPSVKNRSTARGDVPEGLKRRYYTDERGGDGLGFYVDARIPIAAFRDRGRELVAGRLDPNAVRDMAAIAHHRGWAIVTARGSAEFRREAWLAGRSIGLEVRGYQATERDLQELERRRTRAHRREDQREIRHERREDAGAERRLKIVETVVRARVADQDRQGRIIAAARDRVAGWLERGARFDEARQDRARAPERQRGR